MGIHCVTSHHAEEINKEDIQDEVICCNAFRHKHFVLKSIVFYVHHQNNAVKVKRYITLVKKLVPGCNETKGRLWSCFHTPLHLHVYCSDMHCSSAPTTALCHCSKVNLRCCALWWTSVGNDQYVRQLCCSEVYEWSWSATITDTDRV